MKPLVTPLAAVLLSSCSCSNRSPLEHASAATPSGTAPLVARAIPELATLPDPAPADAELDPAPSPEEIAAFRAPVPK